jgi:hypothetical protein
MRLPTSEEAALVLIAAAVGLLAAGLAIEAVLALGSGLPTAHELLLAGAAGGASLVASAVAVSMAYGLRTYTDQRDEEAAI